MTIMPRDGAHAQSQSFRGTTGVHLRVRGMPGEIAGGERADSADRQARPQSAGADLDRSAQRAAAAHPRRRGRARRRMPPRAAASSSAAPGAPR